MRWALRFCILGHRSMDVPKKHSLEAMLALLDAQAAWKSGANAAQK